MILLVSRSNAGSAPRAGGRRRPQRRGAIVNGFSQTFEHRGIALSPAPVWYARAGAAAAPLLLPLPSSDRGGVVVGLEPTTTVRD